MVAPWKRSYDQPRQHIKKQRHYFADKGLYRLSYGFSTSPVWMWKLDHKESWALNWCFWIMVLEKTLENSLDCQEIKPVNPKGNQSWLFTGRTDAKLQPFGQLMWRTDSFEKTLSLGKTEGWRRGWWRTRWLDSIADSVDMNLSKLLEIVEERGAWCAAVHGVAKSWTQLAIKQQQARYTSNRRPSQLNRIWNDRKLNFNFFGLWSVLILPLGPKGSQPYALGDGSGAGPGFISCYLLPSKPWIPDFVS